MSETIIPQSSKQMHPGANQKYVNSRQGGPAEASRTKTASNKHANPEYFKRQSDKKHADSIPDRKDVPIQNNQNNRQPNVGKDVGRGVGCVGKDQGDYQMKQFSKGAMY